MTRFKELNGLLQHLFSANRRKKTAVLMKEWLMCLVSFAERNNQLAANYPPDPVPDTWCHNESRKIDLNFFERGTVVIVEDRVLEDGQIRAEHEYFVQKLHGASAYTNESTHRTVFDRNDQPVERLSSLRRWAIARAPSRRRLPISKTVGGVTANLYGNIASAEGNYSHWFVDALARLFMIERFHSLESIDYVLVPPLKYDFQWESLAVLGFDRPRVIELQPLQCIQFECLLASSPPRGKGSIICPGWLIDRYNEILGEKAEGVKSVAGKRVYISRRDAPNRKFSNEKAVCDFFESRGFDSVELAPLDLWQKIAVFRDADVIVSQTGAGLTNSMFCQPKTKVLELVDENFVCPLYA